MKRNRMHRACIPVLIAIVSVLLLIGTVSASDFGPWSIQTVTSAGNVGQYSSIALDAAGHPAISYYDQTNGDLKYASWDGSRWVITTVDCSKRADKHHWLFFWAREYDREYEECFHGTEKVGEYSSLALDSSGKPRISYYDKTKGDLKYASWDGSRWVVTTVDSNKDVGEYTSLALDAAGHPAISYYDQTNENLKYASWDGSKWVITTVDGSSRTKVRDWSNQHTYNNIAADSPGKSGEHGWDDDHTGRDEHGNNNWKVGKYSSLALDSSGKPRISYYDQTNRDLKYASWDGTKWVITTVDSTKKVGEYASLKLDTNGDPRISYYDATHSDLKFASWDSTNFLWVTETVDSSGKVGKFTSLALDALGNPRISYYDLKNRDLKYAAGTGHTQNPTAPTVTGITPNSGVAGTSVFVTNLAGTNFVAGTTPSVWLVKTGANNITATGVTVVSSTNITCTLPLPAASATSAGQWDVVVKNDDGQSGILTHGFTVTNPAAAPTITGITPITGTTGTTVSITNLAGTGFLTGATVKLTKTGSPDISATSVNVVSSTNIACVFGLTGAATGAWNVVVTNSDSQSGTLTNGFTVTNPAPTVTGITPNGGVAGTSVSVTNLAGTNFVVGTTPSVWLVKTGAGNITATGVTVVSSTNITCTLPLPAASATSAGQWDIVITNDDGQSGKLARGFTVTNPAPTVTGITPNSGVADTSVSVTIDGTNFIVGTTPSVWLAKTAESNITATGVTVVSPTRITCTLPFPPFKATLPGQWDLVVKNEDGQSGSKNAAFTLKNPPPTVTSIEPDSGYNGTIIRIVKVTGNNFGFGENPSIWLAKTGASNITASDVHIYGTTQLDFTLNIPLSAPAGQWDLMVMSMDGQTGAYLGMFTIQQQTGPTPLTWDWSVNGWGDWQHVACLGTGGSCMEYGPVIVNGHGEHGSNVGSDYVGPTDSSVSKTFTAPSGPGWNTLTFNGQLSSSTLPSTRTMTINVNGVDVFTANADQTPPGNGQPFTITKTFARANTVIITISNGQDPTLDTQLYTMQYNSLTLS